MGRCCPRSEWGPEEALSVRHVASLQPPYNLVDRSAEAELLPYCRAHGVGVVVYSALMNGLLSGQIDEHTEFSATDWRGRDERFTGDGLRRNLAIAGQAKALASELGCSQAQLALAWVLANPAVTSGIVGFRNGDEPADLLTGFSTQVDPGLLAALRADQA
jgi:aryl-alcohol dehydrogenase-like predicted oxidoreductase